MRVVFWNIRQGGGATRTPELILAVLALEPDVVALAEFRARGRGDTWSGPLVDVGLVHALRSDAGVGHNGVCIASRWPLRAQGVRASARLLAAEVLCNAARGEHATADGRWSLLVAHVPSEEQARSRVEHLRALREWGASHAGGPALLVGDLNTSRAGLDVPRAGQKHEALLGEVWTTGLRDVWHEQGGSHTQTSWRGPMGERQRLDTALASPALLTQGVRLRYVDEPELSDHAGVVVEWGGDTRE